MFAEVLLELSIHKPLTYVIPPEFESRVEPGVWVEVPLRQRISRGYVVAVRPETGVSSPLPIRSVLSDGPVLTDDLFRLALWMASYYATPIERVLKTMLPSGVRKATTIKRQYLVKRSKTRDELVICYKEIVGRAPAQARRGADAPDPPAGYCVQRRSSARSGLPLKTAESVCLRSYQHLPV